MKALINLLALGKMLSTLQLRQLGAAEVLIDLPQDRLVFRKRDDAGLDFCPPEALAGFPAMKAGDEVECHAIGIAGALHDEVLHRDRCQQSDLADARHQFGNGGLA